MKINELVTPSLGKPTTAAKPPGTMGKVMNKFAQAGGAVKTAVGAANTAVNKFMTAPKDTDAAKDSFASKLGGALASMNKGAGVKDYSKTGVTKDDLNMFVGSLMQSEPGNANFEKELSAEIKARLDNPQDNTSKNKIADKITNFLGKMTNITHGDFNTQFASVLKSLNIKPTDFRDPKEKTPGTAAKPPGTSSILKPTGQPF
jgi:hypothetical protein